MKSVNFAQITDTREDAILPTVPSPIAIFGHMYNNIDVSVHLYSFGYNYGL